MSRLLDVGSAVATPVASSSEHKLAKVQFPQDSTAQLEVRAAAVHLSAAAVPYCRSGWMSTHELRNTWAKDLHTPTEAAARCVLTNC